MDTAWRWRKALGVSQVNEGTARLYQDYAPERLTEEVGVKALKAANSPEANAKKSASRVGKPVHHPKTLKALAAGREKCNSPEARRKRGETNRRLERMPPAVKGPPWSAAETALLGKVSDEEIVRRTGRTLNAVRARRQLHRIRNFGSRARGFAK